MDDVLFQLRECIDSRGCPPIQARNGQACYSALVVVEFAEGVLKATVTTIHGHGKRGSRHPKGIFFREGPGKVRDATARADGLQWFSRAGSRVRAPGRINGHWGDA